MHPVLPEDFSTDTEPRPLWQSLRDLALSVLVVAAIALITAFLTATAVHAQDGEPLRTGHQASASLYVPQKAQGHASPPPFSS